MGVVLTERDHAVADLAVQKMLAALDERERPKVSGQEAAEILGISYATFKCRHLDEGDVFYIPGTKRFWRRHINELKRKREALAA
jgi:exoribonuclease II